MKKTLLALGVAAAALSAAPAQADRHDNNGWRHHDNGWRHHGRDCARWRHGHCVRWMNHGYYRSMERHAAYRVGYVFGPDYRYTSYGAIPRTYVDRYHLAPDGRYVYTNNTVYVVDPATYAITRILTGR